MSSSSGSSRKALLSILFPSPPIVSINILNAASVGARSCKQDSIPCKQRPTNSAGDYFDVFSHGPHIRDDARTPVVPIEGKILCCPKKSSPDAKG